MLHQFDEKWFNEICGEIHLSRCTSPDEKQRWGFWVSICGVFFPPKATIDYEQLNCPQPDKLFARP